MRGRQAIEGPRIRLPILISLLQGNEIMRKARLPQQGYLDEDTIQTCASSRAE